MFNARFDTKELNMKLGNAVSYSYGFLDGVDIEQIEFNRRLGEYTVEALGLYIDSKARMSPDSLHHVYEWGQVGSKAGRLFELKSRASKRVIHFSGSFLASRSVSSTSSVPFTDKANIMENSIEVVIEPKNADILAFEDDGQMIFTTQAIYIENPGGDAVAGSFGRAIEDFFDNYFSNAFLRPFINRLSNPREFSDYFASGAKNGRSVGVKAARKYMRSTGVEIE